MSKSGDYVYRDFKIEDLDKGTVEEHKDINVMFALDYIKERYKLNNVTIKELDQITVDIRFMLHQYYGGACCRTWCVVAK